MIRERPKFLDKRASLIEHRKPKGWARTQRIMFSMERNERTDCKHSENTKNTNEKRRTQSVPKGEKRVLNLLE